MLDVATTDLPLDQIDADLLVIAVGDHDIEDGSLLNQTGTRVAAILRRAIADERFRAKAGQTVIAHVDGQRTARVALVGLGSAPDPAARALRLAAGSSMRAAASVGANRVVLAWSAATRAPVAVAAQAAAEGALLGSYRCDK